MDWYTVLQWMAMLVTITASWLVASKSRRKRKIGFWVFLASNALWVVWGWHDRAFALVTLQLLLAVANVRGAFENEPAASA